MIKDSSFTELPSNSNFMYMKKIDKPIKINDEEIQDKKIIEKRRNTSGKSQANLGFLLFDYIKPTDFLFYIFGNRSTKGEKMIALSAKMTLESLSCEQLIKNNINLYKVINSMDDKQVDVFTNVKPELIKQMENMHLIPNMNEKNKLSQKNG